MSDSEQTVFSGRYELHSLIARGGMANVHLARDQLLDRPVAIKVLFPEFATDPNFVERFRREAQAAANLTHPNIVAVYDWGQEEDQYFIVMEYVDGRSLAQILNAEGSLLPERAADIAIDVAAALGFAHRNGVVNRDVKPGNILISTTGQVKVTDFGIARVFDQGVEENLTQAGSVMGTATYFSPEQAQGKTVDPRSDVYSLGVVLYEMLCGGPPFTGDSPVAIAYKHVQEPPTPLREHKPDLDEALEAIVLKAMAKDVANRYPSAEDLRSDLRRYREGARVLGIGGAMAAAGADATTAMPATGVAPAIDDTGYDEVVYEDEEDYVEPERRSGVFIAVLVVLLLLLVGLLFALARSLGFGDDDKDAEMVTVPDVVGMPLEEARTTLEAEDFEVITEFEKNEDFEKDMVFGQDPAKGEKVEEGSKVKLQVSSGANTIPMPELIGSTEADARALLKSEGFTGEITVEKVFDDKAPEGEVTAQDPPPGNEVPADAPIKLTVSDGPDKRVVPDVSGKTAVEATTELVNAGFTVSERNEFSDSTDQGRVIGTDPKAGTELAKDAPVVIRISQGIEQVTVPNVVGKMAADARNELKTAGFDVGEEQRALDDPDSTDDGKVVGQSPRGNSSAQRGSKITIVIGVAPDPAPTTTTTAPTTTTTAGG